MLRTAWLTSPNVRCFHASCTKRPTLNFESSKAGMYRRQHAEDDMVDVVAKRCLHDTCNTIPSFNVKGSRGPGVLQIPCTGGHGKRP